MQLRFPGVVAQQLLTLSPRAGMVVAVSGGPDSVALLRAILSLPRTDPLVIAHLNHRLRGADSDADEDFVRHLYLRFQAEHPDRLRWESRRLDLASQARAERRNLEAVARQERYRFLRDVAGRHQCGCIVTGHTANDQAETVLHRLLRGTGWRGLRGILPRYRLSAAVEVRRPLLTLRRSDVLSYLTEIGQEFRQDESNFDQRFLRNRIRHELLPLLADRYNPAVVSILNRLAEQARLQYHWLRRESRRVLRRCELPRAGSRLVFDAAKLRQASKLVGCEALRLVWRREGWPLDRMSYRSWWRLWAVVAGRLSAVDLPGGIHVRRRTNVIQIQAKSPT